jgi:predicted cupin superfamily sugar epimerase
VAVEEKNSSPDIVNRLAMTRYPTENGFMSAVFYDLPHHISQASSDGRNTLNAGNIVHFLFEEGNFSHWHRMRTSDEIWMHQSGGGNKYDTRA